MESSLGAASSSAAAPRFAPLTPRPHNTRPLQTSKPHSSNSQGQQSPRHQNGPRRQRGDNAPRNDLPPAPDGHRVIATGYPGYTQAQDLLRVFSKIGNVKVDHVYARCAVLTFTTAEEATAAVQANNKLNIYGQFVAVRPYSVKLVVEEGRQPVKKDYKKNKQKVPTIDPAKIDLSGDFHQQLDNTLAAVRLTQEHVTTLSKLYTDVELVLQALWPGCTAIPFGSITTGLGIKSSDADCFVNIPVQFRHPNANFVTKAKRLLQQHPQSFSEILSIPRANTPIVKFYHIPTQTYCDLTFKTPLGAQNSKLIGFLLHSDPRLLPMAVLIKYWAKVHDISGTGKLTNYALTMMIIFYLQQPHVTILPSVECLQRDSANDFVVDFWNTGFMCKREFLRPITKRSPISELLGGFFEFYASFNFDDLIVCPFLGLPYKKMAFKDIYGLPKEFDTYKVNVLQGNSMPLRFNTPMCVQDPFEQCHNVASVITVRLAQDIQAYFKFAATAYGKEKIMKCENFLRIILLQKPKLIRGKYQPEYIVNLFPRIVATIVSSDWKSVVRNIIHTIVEKMMRIKLGKVEEKVNLDTLKVKEKYSAVLTKAIWKRKQLNKLYAIMNMDFQQTQERITEEIMSIDHQELKIEFHLTILFSQEPRNAKVSIQLNTGDIDAFREFGKFFISVTKPWFVQLLEEFYQTAKKCDPLQNSDGNGSEDSDNDDSPSAGNGAKEPEEQGSPTPPSPTDEGVDSPTTSSPDIENNH